MPTIKSMLIVSSVLFICITAYATESEKPVPPETHQANSLMIIFYPPPGRESDFLNIFVKNQSEYFKRYTNNRKHQNGIQSINIVPIKSGEPLVHLMIYQNKEAYNKAVENFASREQLLNYISNHSKLYGGQKIEAEFLKYSKVHFGEIAGTTLLSKND